VIPDKNFAKYTFSDEICSFLDKNLLAELNILVNKFKWAKTKWRPIVRLLNSELL